jgi:hypothetical protein
MLLTLAGIVTDVRPLAPLNAYAAIASTPFGTTALPVQLLFVTTTLASTVKVPDPVTDPSVTHDTAPSSTATAFAGLKTKPDIVKAKVVIIVAKRRIRFLLPAS